MKKLELFDDEQQALAAMAKVLSHPARIAILQFLAATPTCISGDISDFLPLSRTTVSQHLKELKSAGLIQGEVEGLKIKYCLHKNGIEKLRMLFGDLLAEIMPSDEKSC
ncbi:metalloregulator ArsR/SmtB family transcription factor [Labilibaculum sp. DW002]|uniref:Metalloregulator ArsR/SmtB family transcription factor n=1 Tax=Paralabilibaculum antarcticum TaxID=2912572 RepID=A0ABT5VW92_9BACT|nr:metalloregulator ArsR/SmtB family transcription factor [Labilibaculum sp. DW002]MDE5419688.1 metalloregulator ArsR/SmtB family transcription factor [Labilibaculum sp. DW002]